MKTKVNDNDFVRAPEKPCVWKSVFRDTRGPTHKKKKTYTDWLWAKHWTRMKHFTCDTTHKKRSRSTTAQELQSCKWHFWNFWIKSMQYSGVRSHFIIQNACRRLSHYMVSTTRNPFSIYPSLKNKSTKWSYYIVTHMQVYVHIHILAIDL